MMKPCPGAGLHEGLPGGHVEGHLGAVGELFTISVGCFQHILCEAHGEVGDAGVEFAEAFLLVGGHVGAAAHEVLVVLLEQAHLLGVEAEALALVVDGLDAGEEGCVEGYVVAMLRQQGRHLFLDGFHLGAVLALAEVEEDGADFVEQLTAVLEGEDGVFEGGCLGVIDDGVDFGLLLFHAFAEGGHVVFGLDAAEVGDFVRSVPLAEEGIVHVFLVFAACQQHDCRGGKDKGAFHNIMCVSLIR